ncbi:major facilitator superfamily domain-containing protein [Gilbertella persicaria]|uniref:major facilitator superfamily domain-containing protein n=1 Tax=Gilbertella persicaria TaxID=101096 RepID=UPI00221EA478|nr:major facilitator superfamily domain-containing protein [Gilbertella persicaria]KAI8092237.1 major facilitator superfamily domain-containing protein [Gilbertella persicaria]
MPIERNEEVGSNRHSSLVWRVPLACKIDFQILPALCIFYFFSSLDRSSTEFVDTNGLARDLNINGKQLSTTTSMYYFCSIILNLPSNIILRRWRASYWLGIIMGIWGMMCICTAACTNYNRLVIVKLCSNICDAAFLPGVIYYLSLWYTRSELGLRLGIFWSCRCLAIGFGRLFAYGVSHMNDSDMHIWQWTYIFQGAPCIVLAIITSWHLPNDIKSSPFLVEQERKILIRKLEDDCGAFNDNDWSWEQVGSTLTDPKMFAYILLYILVSAVLQGTTLLLPTVIEQMKISPSIQGHLLTIPPYILAIMSILVLSFTSGHRHSRSRFILLLNIMSIAILIALKLMISYNKYDSYIIACILISITYAQIVLVTTWTINNFVGFTRRAIAIGIIVSFGLTGSAAGSQLFQDAPAYARSKSIVLALFIAQFILVCIVRYSLSRETKRRMEMNSDARQYQIYKAGGVDLAGDRHPDFSYTL